MKQQLEQIKTAALEAIAAAKDSADCENVRVKYLGKKGELTAILKMMGGLSPEERPIMGQLVNTAKAEVDAALSAKVTEMQAAAEELKLKEETIDIRMPAKTDKTGKLHPLNTVLNDMIDIFQSMGFDVVDGPEVETDHYNFECLNVPADHPARDMQDTFYLAENILLRTQTSAAQIRTMETRKPPIRVICPGRVFRADEVDATHSPVFHQIEGLVVDKGVTMLERNCKVAMSLESNLYPTVPAVTNATKGFCIVKKSTTLRATARITGFNNTFLREIFFLSPVKIYTPNVQLSTLNTARITAQ